MIARYAGTCTECGDRFDPGTEIKWSRASKSAAHRDCDPDFPVGCPADRDDEVRQQNLIDDRYDAEATMDDWAEASC